MSTIAKKPESSKDRISDLPDSLLHHILSFLKLKEVIATSVLSTRWRFLWRSVPTLDLGTWSSYSSGHMPGLISISLMLYDSLKIQKFRAHFTYPQIPDCYLDFWIRFATMRDVVEFDLNLCQVGEYDYDKMVSQQLYKVLQCLFNCRSLEKLKLAFCELAPCSCLNLCMLRELKLSRVKLSDLDTSGCPVLESLVLEACRSGDHLNLYCPNKKLGYLKIDGIDDSALTIFAPNVLDIQFSGFMRRSYTIKNLSSVRSFTFELEHLVYCDVEAMQKFLPYVCNASTIQLCSKSTQLFRLLQRLLPPIRATCLVLKTDMHKQDLIGMARVLGSSQYIESLILHIEGKWPHFADAKFYEACELLKRSLSTNRQLKVVKINILHHELSLDELCVDCCKCIIMPRESCMVCRRPQPSANIDKFLDKWDKEINLIKLLLGSCMKLEKMIISTAAIQASLGLKSKFLLGLSKRLLDFPRVSVNAKICLL